MMIEWLNKSYVEFPKQEDETERTLSVTNYSDQMRIRMTLHIKDIRHHAEEIMSHLEYESLKRTDIDDVLLRRVCRKFRETFE